MARRRIMVRRYCAIEESLDLLDCTSFDYPLPLSLLAIILSVSEVFILVKTYGGFEEDDVITDCGNECR